MQPSFCQYKLLVHNNREVKVVQDDAIRNYFHIEFERSLENETNQQHQLSVNSDVRSLSHVVLS